MFLEGWQAGAYSVLLKGGKPAGKEKGRKRQATEAKRQLIEVDFQLL
jgi:hypothetical protein